MQQLLRLVDTSTEEGKSVFAWLAGVRLEYKGGTPIGRDVYGRFTSAFRPATSAKLYPQKLLNGLGLALGAVGSGARLGDQIALHFLMESLVHLPEAAERRDVLNEFVRLHNSELDPALVAATQEFDEHFQSVLDSHSATIQRVLGEFVDPRFLVDVVQLRASLEAAYNGLSKAGRFAKKLTFALAVADMALNTIGEQESLNRAYIAASLDRFVIAPIEIGMAENFNPASQVYEDTVTICASQSMGLYLAYVFYRNSADFIEVEPLEAIDPVQLVKLIFEKLVTLLGVADADRAIRTLRINQEFYLTGISGSTLTSNRERSGTSDQSEHLLAILRTTEEAAPTVIRPPTVGIAVSPQTAVAGIDEINFTGSGEDQDDVGPKQVLHRWTSNLGFVGGGKQLYPEEAGSFGSAASFNIPAMRLVRGEHRIVHEVRDNEGTVVRSPQVILVVVDPPPVSGRDVSIEILRSSVETLRPGDTVSGQVRVRNLGTQDEQVAVHLELRTEDKGERLGQQDMSSSLQKGGYSVLDVVLQPSRNYQGRFVVTGTASIAADSNPSDNHAEVGGFYGEIPSSTVFGPRSELHVPSSTGTASLRGHNIVVKGWNPGHLYTRVDGEDVTFDAGKETYLRFPDYYLAWGGSGSQSYVFFFWFADGRYDLSPVAPVVGQGTDFTMTWQKKGGSPIPNQYWGRFLAERAYTDLGPWKTAGDANFVTELRMTLRVPETAGVQQLSALALLAGQDGSPEAITVRTLRVTASPPETTIIRGPATEGMERDVCCAWGGSDDTTPATDLVFAWHLLPLEEHFTEFQRVTKWCYTNLSDGSYRFVVKARDRGGNEDPTPATYEFVVNTQHYPDRPHNVFPPDKLRGIPPKLILYGSAFSDPDLDAQHALTQVQLSALHGTIKHLVWDQASALGTSVPVPDNILEPGTTYTWTMQYTDQTGRQSGWSSETSFTTRAAKPLAVEVLKSTSGDLVVTWTDLGPGFGYTVGVASESGGVWAPAPPEGQWPTTSTAWRDGTSPRPGSRFYRVTAHRTSP